MKIMSKIDLVKLLASRGRGDIFAQSFTKDGKINYKPIRGQIGEKEISQHLSSGPYLGVYFLNSNSTRSYLAAIDFDDKEAVVGQEKMKKLVGDIYDHLTSEKFSPIIERSGSGSGYHIWLLFQEEQEAGQIRTFLTSVIEKFGYKEGAGSVARMQLELFPRQAHLAEGEVGNLIALPFNRKSAILSRKFEDVPESSLSYIHRKFSRSLVGKDFLDINKAKTEKSKQRKEKESESAPTIEEVRQCLSIIPNDDVEYDEWLSLLYATHNATGGSEKGYELFLEWSRKSDKHDPKELDKVWSKVKERNEGGVTWKTLLHKAKENGWNRFQDILDSLVYVREQDMIYNLVTGGTFTEGSLKRAYMHLHKSMGEYFLSSSKSKKVDRYIYYPGKDRVYSEKGVAFLNRWKDPGVEPIRGDVTPFIAHMGNLFPDELERNHMLDFLACIVQRPGQKIKHCPIIQGEQGIGKSYLSYVMKVVLGQENVRDLPNTALNSDFNGFLANVQLLVIEELYAKNRFEISNSLKIILTQEEILVNEKHEKPYHMPNIVNFIALTNHRDPITLEPTDRRYFAYFSPLNPATLHRDYFTDLFSWTARSGSFLKYFFLERDISRFNPHSAPPMTEAKKEMLRISKTNDSLFLERVIENKDNLDFLRRDLIGIEGLRLAAKSFGIQMDDRSIYKSLTENSIVRSKLPDVWIIRNVPKWSFASVEDQRAEYNRKIMIQSGSDGVVPFDPEYTSRDAF